MSFFNVSNNPASPWKIYEKVALRFFFAYFVIQAVPLDPKFYRVLFDIHWLHPHFYQLFILSKYEPQFFSFTGYANWAVAALIAVIAALTWTFIEKKDPDYHSLLYWLRVLLRYRLAIGVIAYGILKLFPLQMPYPSLSNLHTDYGQFLPWKIYFHTIGITQWYESFLGAVEIVAGFLLFFRRTATFGAGIILGFVGNVLYANSSYNIGEQVYCAYLLSLALFLFVYDVPRLYNLLILERQTIADKFVPVFRAASLRNARIVLRTAFLAFVVLFGIRTYGNYLNDPYKIPKGAGISGTYGYYNVREFKFNNVNIPYSTTDLNRWQNVVFEKWATISIKTARPVKIDNSRAGEFYINDADRNYESAGVGDRRYFAYTADTISRVIRLHNKNRNLEAEQFQLRYERPNDSTIIVRGINEKRDSIYAVLDRISKKYMLFVGRRKPLKL